MKQGLKVGSVCLRYNTSNKNYKSYRNIVLQQTHLKELRDKKAYFCLIHKR